MAFAGKVGGPERICGSKTPTIGRGIQGIEELVIRKEKI